MRSPCPGSCGINLQVEIFARKEEKKKNELCSVLTKCLVRCTSEKIRCGIVLESTRSPVNHGTRDRSS